MTTREHVSVEGKVVLITGAAGGIGSAVAQVFAEAGARLALLDRDETGLRRLADTLVTEGATVTLASADLRSEVGVREGISAVLAPSSGHLDILVANVGQLIAGRFMELTPEAYGSAFVINHLSHVWACQCVLPGMLARGQGALVFVGSDQGLQPDADLSPYACCKAATHALVKVLSREVGPEITVNAVAPGMTRTPLVGDLLAQRAREFNTPPEEAERLELARRGVPLGRVLEPEEVARAIFFLATNPASTGCILDLSGGNVRSVAS